MESRSLISYMKEHRPVLYGIYKKLDKDEKKALRETVFCSAHCQEWIVNKIASKFSNWMENNFEKYDRRKQVKAN